MSLQESIIGPELTAALVGRGFERLTPVQEAVLAPELEGRDLRISSQTGSGKTVAIGLAVRDALERVESDDGNAHPRALIIVPTRELAKQVEEELRWLFAGLPVGIASVTGGGGYRDELRAFRKKPVIVVGTPGRMLDHLKRGAIDASAVATVVLDEADRMLDLGFREDILAIFGYAPEERRTHLVSATFPHEVKSLANRVQKDPVTVEGTPLGTANADIEHLLHLVHQDERLAAIINLLLEAEGQTLIFARTRADVAELTGLLQDAGFSIASLSGEMEQAERNRALAAFKRGNIDALVATDVAARGIDVSDVTRVIHAEPPTDADAYTHRSGRTGRAGKKGISSVLVTPRELQRTMALLGRAKVNYRFEPIPTAESLREARDNALLERLSADFVEGTSVDERSLALAERVLGSPEPARAVARLIADALAQQTEAREVTPIAPPQERPKRDRAPNRDGWVRFRISWGTVYGAEVRRLVAMLCRRGKIEGRDIGAINLGRTSSVVEVSAAVADAFERATAKPDPRDPRIQIRRWSDEPVRGAPPPTEEPRERAPRPAPRSAPAIEAPPDRPSRTTRKNTSAELPESETRLATPPDRPSRSAPKSARDVAAPSDRPSRAAAKSERDVAPDRPSRAAAKSERDVAPDRPSRAAAKSERDVASDRPSRAAAKSERDVAPDRPSRAAAKSERDVAAPADRPSRAAKSEREVTAPASAPDTVREAPTPKRKEKKKREEPAFTPREAVIRRDKPKPRPHHDARPQRPERPRDDARPQRPERPRDDARPQRPDGPRPKRGGPPPWERRGGGHAPPKRRR